MDKMEVLYKSNDEILEELYQIFKELQNDSSRTGKEMILEREKKNKTFKEVLFFVYNPFVITGLSTKKINKKIVHKEPVGRLCMHYSVTDIMDYLKKNNTGTDNDIDFVQYAIRQYSQHIQELLKEICTKKLKCGLTSTTINKVYGENFIPTFGVMKAEGYDKHSEKFDGEYFASQKLNGNRCIVVNGKNGAEFYTKKGLLIDGMVELEEQFPKLPEGYVYDGELRLINKDNLSDEELFQATQSVIRQKGVKLDLNFYIYDALPIKEFFQGKSKETYKKRREFLDYGIVPHFDNSLLSLTMGYTDDCFIGDKRRIYVLETLYHGTDKSKILELKEFARENGWEGIMINTADGLYETKRVKQILKVKFKETADLLCIGMEEGTGENLGTLGSILVEYKGNSVGVCGFTKEDRDFYWNNPNEIVGKIVEVSHWGESKDRKTGLPSLKYAQFKCIRDDKDVEDINYEV